MIQFVRQAQKFDCMAACAAMLTGHSLGYVTTIIGHDGSQRPFTFKEIASFMLLHDYHLGKPLPGWPGAVHTKRSEVALVIVRQESGAHHAVVWDGKQAVNPLTAKTRPIQDYTVHQWWPVVRIVWGEDGDYTQYSITQKRVD